MPRAHLRKGVLRPHYHYTINFIIVFNSQSTMTVLQYFKNNNKKQTLFWPSWFRQSLPFTCKPYKYSGAWAEKRLANVSSKNYWSSGPVGRTVPLVRQQFLCSRTMGPVGISSPVKKCDVDLMMYKYIYIYIYGHMLLVL